MQPACEQTVPIHLLQVQIHCICSWTHKNKLYL